MAVNTVTNEKQVKFQSISGIRAALHLEGLAVLLASVVLYAEHGGGWLLFAVLLLVPDLAFIPYMVDKELGRMVYNLVHTYTLPLALGTAALLLDWSTGLSLALIWTAHIGMDRSIGYGLKYATDFKDTHLQRM